MRDQSVILFDYRNRDALFGNACRAFRLILSGESWWEAGGSLKEDSKRRRDAERDKSAEG